MASIKEGSTTNKYSFDIKVALIGYVSVGKSTVLNALLGDKFSEVALKRTTAGVNFFNISQPTEESPDDGWSEVEDEGRKIQEAEDVHEEISKDNEELRSSWIVEEKKFDIRIRHPICKMRKDTQLVLVDIPGINEAESSKKYKEYVESNWKTFDCVVLVMDAVQGVNTQEQVDLLKFVKGNNKNLKDVPTIVLGNKLDDFDDDDTINQIKETRAKTIEIFGNVDCRFVPASAIDEEKVEKQSSDSKSANFEILRQNRAQSEESTESKRAPYPPMSSAAPKKVFWTKAEPKSDSSLVNFELLRKDQARSEEPSESKRASSSTYPPMPSAAPKNPFARKAAEKTTKPKSHSSSHPPMSSSAPKNPFGSKATEKTMKPKSDSSSYPPMSSSAPKNPFAPKATEETTKAKKPKSDSSPYPPISFLAPKNPFASRAARKRDRPCRFRRQILRPIHQDMDYNKAKLIQFFREHNASKLDMVDAILKKYKGKEVELFQKLEAKYAGKTTAFPPPSGDGPRCYLEFTVGDDTPFRVVVKLYKDKAPLAAENFRCLCTGEITTHRADGKPLHYLRSIVHRITPGFCIQGGDFITGNGFGGASIYPPNSEHGDAWGKFQDEPLAFLDHSKKGLLCMANNGKNTNSSQFLITLDALPYLNGKNVVFGEVEEGMELLEKMSNLALAQEPKVDVVISACGEIDDSGKDVAFIPLSAKNAFLYRKALSLDRNDLVKHEDLINKIGIDEFGRKFIKQKLEEKIDAVLDILEDPSELKERLADTNFNSFLSSLSNFIGGEAKQKDILEKKVSMELKSISIDSIGQFRSASEFILEAYNKSKVIGLSDFEWIKSAFWDVYKEREIRIFYSNPKRYYGPECLDRPFQELKKYHTLTRELGWTSESLRAKDAMNQLLRKQLLFVLNKLDGWSFEGYCRSVGGTEWRWKPEKDFRTKENSGKVYGKKVLTDTKKTWTRYFLWETTTPGMEWIDGWKILRTPENFGWQNLSPQDWIVILESLSLVWNDRYFVNSFGAEKTKLGAALSKLYSTFHSISGINLQCSEKTDVIQRICVYAYKEEVERRRRTGDSSMARLQMPLSLDSPNHWGYLASQYVKFCFDEEMDEILRVKLLANQLGASTL